MNHADVAAEEEKYFLQKQLINTWFTVVQKAFLVE